MKRVSCSGILFLDPTGSFLFLQRSGHGDYAGYWSLPGGHLNDGETTKEGAIRETLEETGYKVKNDLVEINRQIIHKDEEEIDFTTFLCRVDEQFTPKLNDEHTGFSWAQLENAPNPIHPGLSITFQKMGSDELGIAKMMVEGDLPSPQQYMNITLFDIRITGTGLSYRSGPDEFVWRDNSIYLNEEFLQRCNGLPVVFQHPEKAVLNTKEYIDRNIGSVFIPYIKGDEVWAIVKVWDKNAANLMSENQLSTSPGVVLYGGDEKVDVGNKKFLLIEGKPRLLDHIAICFNGVWDKGNPPSGVSSINVGDVVMADASDEKAAAIEAKKPDSVKLDAEKMARFDEALDKTLKCLDSLSSRMDAFEESEKEKEKKKADKKKADADAEEEKRKVDAELEEKKKKADAEIEEKKKMDAEEEKRKADAVSDVRKRIADVENRLPKQLNDADYAAMADAQVGADKIFLMHGKRAPRPLDGETLIAYRRRLASNLKEHSPAWKGIELSAIADDNAFTNIERTIYADAVTAGLNPVEPAEDYLREIISEDITGRKISTFAGKPSAWMGQFSSNKRRLVGIRNNS